MEDESVNISRGTLTEESDDLLLVQESAKCGDSLSAMEVEGQASHNHSNRLARARRLLYVSHLFAQFSEVSWQFCLILFLGAFANYESLILVSTYGLVSGLAVCMTGSWTGRFIDGAERLLVAHRFIWCENLSVMLATTSCYFLLNRARSQHQELESYTNESLSWIQQCLRGVPLDVVSVVLLVAIHIFGSLARILDRGFMVAIERDWIVQMSRMASPSYTPPSKEQVYSSPHTPNEQEKAWLSETNVALKQIDLSCQIAGPALAGIFIATLDDGSSQHHGGDLTGAAVLIGMINIASLVTEYVCTMKIYRMVPDLAFKSLISAAPTPEAEENEEGLAIIAPCPTQDRRPEFTMREHDSFCSYIRLPHGLDVYFKQQVSCGGLGLALLYLNALSFSSIMTAYLVWRGMRLEAVGIWRGVACAVGLLGTVVYHKSTKYLSLESTGMWSILFQFLCLSLSYLSLFVTDNTESLVMLIAGVCCSRIGLWVFDIAVTQQMQEYVPADVRGVVGGVQESLNAFFELLSFGLGIVFPDPRKFHVYVSAGYLSVGIAALLYAFGVFFRRDRLISK